MTLCDVIGLRQVTISPVTVYNCFLTVEDYTKDTQEIPGTQLPYDTDVVRGGSLSYIEEDLCHMQSDSCPMEPMAIDLYIRIATVGITIRTVNSPMYDTYMSTPGNTAKLGATHSNIQTAQSSPSLVWSEPTMH